MDLTAIVQVDNARADGTTANRIVYSLKDGATPVADHFLTFTAFSTSGGAKLSAAFGQTDTAGTFILDITDTTPEGVLITAASASSSFPSLPTEVTFTEVTQSYSLEPIITVNGSPADGVSQNKIMFIVRDALGMPAPGKLLQFIPATNLSLTDTFIETDSTGSATLGCTSLLENSYTLTAIIYGEEGTYPVHNITFVKADQLDALTAVILKNNADADGADYCEIQYRLTKKSTRDVVSNQPITIELNSITAFPSVHTLVTDYAGIAVLKVYDTESEEVTVSAYASNERLSAHTEIEFGSADPGTVKGTAKNAGNYSFDMLFPYYNFTAGHTYRFIVAVEGTQQECSSGRYSVKGTCTTSSAPTDTVYLEGNFSFSNGTRDYYCLKPGTAVYSTKYFYLTVGQKYSATIQDLSA